MELRDWLQQEMTAKGLNPSTLAARAKVPQPTIFRILSGETKDPRIGTVKKLEHALGSKAPAPASDTLPAAHTELLAAWENLLPSERDALLAEIKQKAQHNKEVANHFRVVKVAERRVRQVHFDFPDRRKQNEGGQ